MLKTYDIFVDIPKVEAFVTPFPVELISTLAAPTYDATHPRNFKRFMHVMIPNCKAGDIIDVEAMVEVTSEWSLTEFCAGLVLTPDATGTAGIQDLPNDLFAIGLGENPPNGVWVSKISGGNLTLSMHHYPLTPGGIIVVPEGYSGTLYVAMIGYADAGAFTGRNVTIEPHSGNIGAVVHRKP